MDFHYGNSPRWMVIHDLRLEHNGHTAQINHLLINRFLEVYVCESKRFHEGISINEHGEFSAFYQGRAYGIPSPIEQNNRHITLLQRFFDADETILPARLGLKIKPKLFSLILVANSARISRPKNHKNIPGLDRIIKNEQVVKKIEQDIAKENIFSVTSSIAKLISSDSLQAFAEALAALHQPLTIDWKARFGIDDISTEAQTINTVEPSAPPPVLQAIPETQVTEEASKKEESKSSEESSRRPTRLFCASCRKTVTPNIAKFCWNNTKRFNGKVYCFQCQKNMQ
ncbi:nuclease-related domain-containing protein [Neisseria arctica]|uniref:nuclease-related domain-containing protein n=1 Tax=Neisseria arctica TaxID=1470200 RepID=UPI001F468AA8|nr:nuclease-related domain-containing protein [Neisseria arctica]UOO87720.1 NERD domain-containing protein [Neisseria arctica]